MRNFIYAILAIISLIALWFFMAPSAPQTSVVAFVATPDLTTNNEPKVAIETADYHWQIQAGKIIGPQQVEVPQNETLLLSFISDVPDEVHLHGYEQAVQINANEPATLRVRLEHSGRFELETHRLHRVISVLEVEPR
jgi:hypothetical protein